MLAGQQYQTRNSLQSKAPSKTISTKPSIRDRTSKISHRQLSTTSIVTTRISSMRNQHALSALDEAAAAAVYKAEAGGASVQEATTAARQQSSWRSQETGKRPTYCLQRTQNRRRYHIPSPQTTMRTKRCRQRPCRIQTPSMEKYSRERQRLRKWGNMKGSLTTSMTLASLNR